MLHPQVIANIRAFLERVQLTGREVPAYTQAMMALAVEERAAQTPAPVKDVPASSAAPPAATSPNEDVAKAH